LTNSLHQQRSLAPTYQEAHIGARFLLVKGIKVNEVTRYSDYKRFNVETLNTISKPKEPKATDSRQILNNANLVGNPAVRLKNIINVLVHRFMHSCHCSSPREYRKTTIALDAVDGSRQIARQFRLRLAFEHSRSEPSSFSDCPNIPAPRVILNRSILKPSRRLFIS